MFEADGTLRWVQQFGTDGTDSAFEPRFVGDQVVVTGTAGGVLGDSHAGGRDAMVAWLDAATGEVDRVEQFGTDTDDEAYGLAVDSDGSVWAGGSTGGAISEGVTSGDTDIFLIRFDSDSESQASSGPSSRPLEAQIPGGEESRSRQPDWVRATRPRFRQPAGGKGPALARRPGVEWSSNSSTHGTLSISASSDTPVS